MWNRLDKIATWENLRVFASNRLIGGSSIFLFMVPIAAKLFADAPDRIRFPHVNSELLLNLKLPFSWILLFFAALFILVGEIIYLIFCPQIVKRYKNFSEFDAAGRSSADLLNCLREIVPVEIGNRFSSTNADESSIARDQAVQYVIRDCLDLDLNDRRRTFLIESIHPSASIKSVTEHLSKAFVVVRDAAGFHNIRERRLTAILFVVAACFIAIIVIQKVSFVVEYLFKKGV